MELHASTWINLTNRMSRGKSCRRNYMGFPGGAVIENAPANVGDEKDPGSIPGQGTKIPHAGTKDLHAVTKTQCSQIH